MALNLNNHYSAELPFADISFRVKITVGTAVPTDGEHVEPLHRLEQPHVHFRTRHLGQNDVGSLSDFLAADLASTTGLVVM